MAEEFQRNKQYSYDNNSSLVLKADRSNNRNERSNDGDGTVQSLKGKLQNQRMGDRIDRSTNRPELDSGSSASASASIDTRKRQHKDVGGANA